MGSCLPTNNSSNSLPVQQQPASTRGKLHVLITEKVGSNGFGQTFNQPIRDAFPDCVLLSQTPNLATALNAKGEALAASKFALLATIEQDILLALLALLPSPQTPLLQISDGILYSDLHVARHPHTSLVYMYPDGSCLHDKDNLSRTIQTWSAKRRVGGEVAFLEDHFPPSNTFQMPSCSGDPDFADALREELQDTIDTGADTCALSVALCKNQYLQPREQEWWILKPSLLDRGEGIRLFSDWNSLEAVFRDYGLLANVGRFTAQRYIHPPLLLPKQKRKWHIRAYAIVAEMLKVWVFEEMLMLFAPAEYHNPWDSVSSAVHLTNMSQLPNNDPEAHTVLLTSLDADWKKTVVDQICSITADVFAAAGTSLALGPRPNCFEIFGLDFIVDASKKAWLLEINEGPDLSNNDGLATELVAEAIRVAVQPYFDPEPRKCEKSLIRCRLVFDRRLWARG